VEENNVFFKFTFREKVLLERRNLGGNGIWSAEFNHHFSLSLSPMMAIEKSFRKLNET